MQPKTADAAARHVLGASEGTCPTSRPWMLPRRIRIVSYDVAELGTRAATTLLDRIASGSSADGTAQLVPTTLVTRGGRG